jgi:hypothetical protein
MFGRRRITREEDGMYRREPVGTHEYKRGLRKVYENIYRCKNCGRMTNCAWVNDWGFVIMACGPECANDYGLKEDMRRER